MPWNILLNLGGSIYKDWSNKRAEKKVLAHKLRQKVQDIAILIKI